MSLSLNFINVDTRPDRRAFMEAQFTAHGLAVDRLSGTTPDNLTSELSGRLHPDMRWRDPLTPSERACLDSHARLWRAVAARETGVAVILEDDIVLSPALPELLMQLEDSQGWDVLRLETNFQPIRVGRSEVRIAGRRARRAMQPLAGSGAYAITSRAAARCLASPYFGAAPSDTLLFAAPGIFEQRVFQLVPGLAAHLEQIPGREHEPAAQSEIGKTRSPIIVRARAAMPTPARGSPAHYRDAARAAISLLGWFSPIDVALSRRVPVPFDDAPLPQRLTE